MSGVGGLFIFQCFYTEVGEKGGGGGLGDGCTSEGGLDEFSRTLIKFNNFKEFTQTKAFMGTRIKQLCIR